MHYEKYTACSLCSSTDFRIPGPNDVDKLTQLAEDLIMHIGAQEKFEIAECMLRRLVTLKKLLAEEFDPDLALVLKRLCQVCLRCLSAYL